MTPAIMSSQTPNTITDELQKAYKAALLGIVDHLESDQQEKLQFYYEGLIPSGTDGIINILRSLESVGKISWKDVGSLKEGLYAIQRPDLVEILTAFETRRELTLFLDDYARKRQEGSESRCYQSVSSIELLAKHLVDVTTEIFTDGLNNSKVRSLMKSRKNVQEVLFDFEEQIVKEQVVNPWSKLTFLVVIAGEVVAVMMPAIDEERQTEPKEVLRICLEFCYTRLKKLGSWVS